VSEQSYAVLYVLVASKVQRVCHAFTSTIGSGYTHIFCLLTLVCLKL